MAQELQTVATQKQQQAGTRDLIDAIALLEKSEAQVEQAIQQKLQENPLLDEVQSSEPKDETRFGDETEEKGESILRSGDKSKVSEKWDWDADYPNDEKGWPDHIDDEKNLSPTERTPDEPLNPLQFHLLQQLRLSKLNVVQMEIGLNIIGNLNDDGFLEMSAEDLCQDMGRYLPETVQNTIRIIQQFDPTGVASRDCRECLLSQASTSPRLKGTICETILRDHWSAFLNKEGDQIAKALSIPLAEVKSAMHLIASALNPWPGRDRRFINRSLYENPSLSHVTPDLYVYADGHDYRVEPAYENTPFKMNSVYESMLHQGNGLPENTLQYLHGQKQKAQFFAESIRRRRETIIRLAKSLTKHQGKFFDTGSVLSLKPLISSEVADEINMNDSTVRRARKNKYVDTPHGLFDLDFFFDKAGFDTQGGTKTSAKAVQQTIRQLIRLEEKDSPLTDEEMSDILKEKYSIKVGRRVVTKYREVMGFLSARLRKRL